MNAVYLVNTYKFLNSYFYIHLIHCTNLCNTFNSVLKAKYKSQHFAFIDHQLIAGFRQTVDVHNDISSQYLISLIPSLVWFHSLWKRKHVLGDVTVAVVV